MGVCNVDNYKHRKNEHNIMKSNQLTQESNYNQDTMKEYKNESVLNNQNQRIFDNNIDIKESVQYKNDYSHNKYDNIEMKDKHNSYEEGVHILNGKNDLIQSDNSNSNNKKIENNIIEYKEGKNESNIEKEKEKSLIDILNESNSESFQSTTPKILQFEKIETEGNLYYLK